MKFYTYASQIFNKIYIREIDSKGEEYSETVNFTPTLYVPAPKEKANFRTLDHKPLANLQFPSIKECKEFADQYSGVSNFQIYGNTNYVFQYLSTHYSGDVQWDASKILIYTLDIEVASDDGFPDIRLAN